jgi:hypothetical protein
LKLALRSLKIKYLLSMTREILRSHSRLAFIMHGCYPSVPFLPMAALSF